MINVYFNKLWNTKFKAIQLEIDNAIFLISYLPRFELHGDGALCLTCCTGCGPRHREKFIPQVHSVLLQHRGCFVKCDSPGNLDIFKGPRSKAKPVQMQQQSALSLGVMQNVLPLCLSIPLHPTHVLYIVLFYYILFNLE